MAFKINDRVKETSTTTGITDFSLLGAATGYESFSTGIGDANSTYYCITAGSEWEVGIGTYTAVGSILSRTTVLSSSNADALVSFSAGTKEVFVGAPAAKIWMTDTLHAADLKVAPVDADEIPLIDSESQFAVKRLTLTNLIATLSESMNGGYLFSKLDAAQVCFTKTGAGTLSIKAGTSVTVYRYVTKYMADTAVAMPTLTGGTDYAIYVCTDGSIRADASFTNPIGYTTLNSRKIGGFHYAPGGNALARAGGDSIPAINEYSIWDLKYRPACPDPRGKAQITPTVWQCIYPLGVSHPSQGASKFSDTIADGLNPPPNYTTFTRFDAAEVLSLYGLRLPTYAEFSAGAFGTTEAAAGSTDPATNILRAAFTSKFGIILATGNMWFWGAEFGGGEAAAGWVANTGGRGGTFGMENSAIFGGFWGDGANCGSRASAWNSSPTASTSSIGARGVCDHYGAL